MDRIIHNELITGTTVSGTFSSNTSPHLFGIMREVIVAPTQDATTYDIVLTNDQSLISFRRTSQTGPIGIETALPIKGVYTVKIENSTSDELFKIQLGVDQ